jgi:hypothetical protein
MKEELPERYFYQKRKIVKIGQILKNILPKKNIEDKTYQQVKNAWRHIVGEEVCKDTKIVGLKSGILFVHAESTTVIHHLTNFEKHAIIEGINNILGTKYIEDIRFKTGILYEGRK